MTSINLDPNSDLHLSNEPLSDTLQSEQVININPRELSMDNVNSEVVSKQQVSLSGIAGISSVAETLKNTQTQQSNTAAALSGNNYSETVVINEPIDEVIVDSSGQSVMTAAFVLFLVSLLAAAYFLYQYFL